jgi:hypothetical protein
VTRDDGDLASPAAVAGVLREYGLLGPDEPAEITELSGGVSSTVFMARAGGRCMVVKQALGQLRVAQEWLVSPERSSTEADCAFLLTQLVPGSVPRPLHADPGRHAFVMECAPDGAETWKVHLMTGRCDPAVARQAGRVLGRIHGGTAGDPAVRARFGDRTLFGDLRIEPYLVAASRLHPDVGLLEIAHDLRSRGECLVHGDFSPKNLLVGPAGDVLLVDHEVAHYGDPAFDLAFVLSHLWLKAVRFPPLAAPLAAAAGALVDSYAAESGAVGEAARPRVPRLVGALMLARVDGKSPVEYLDGNRQDRVRSIARRILLDAPATIDALPAYLGVPT